MDGVECMRKHKFPLVLAGPIVRRVETRRAFIWIATSRNCFIDASFYAINQISENSSFDYQQIATSTEQMTVQAGKRLFIHLIKITPKVESFPTDTLIGYNLQFIRGTLKQDLKSLHHLSPEQPQSIVYGKLAYPSFLIKSGDSKTSNIFYGSCRKLHGEGEDMLASSDMTLETNYQSISKRPDSLFMTGDQIYADDVAESMILTISSLSHELIGQEEPLHKLDSRLGEEPYSSELYQINGRKSIIEDMAMFTTSHPENHLIEFGEFAAMYLLSWNPELWVGVQINSAQDSPNSTNHLKTDLSKPNNHSEEQHEALTALQKPLWRVRRLLANIPSYMIFDDHDITDDWNISATWKKNAQDAPLGRHIIANGLAAYWAFQGWGNDPDAYDLEFIVTMNDYFKTLRNGRYDTEALNRWQKQLLSFQSWHFITPTHPEAVFLDTRTLRDYDSKPYPKKLGRILRESEGCPQLVSKHGWSLVTAKLQESTWKSRNLLIVVSATPVYGMGLIESFLQDFVYPFQLLGADVRTSFDFEAWKYNGKGFTQFLSQIGEWDPSVCIILSGDVHYASAVKANVTFSDGKVLPIRQFTSSPYKNRSFTGVWGYMMKKVIDYNSLSRKHNDIHRVCDTSYHISHVENNEVNKPYLWKDQLRYQLVEKDSLVETNNNLGLITIHDDAIQNTFIKE